MMMKGRRKKDDVGASMRIEGVAMTMQSKNVSVFVQEALARLLPLIERLAAPPPPLPAGIWPSPPHPMTGSEIRRTIRRYRAGKVRPLDPSIDPLDAADVIEKDLAYAELADTVEDEVDDMYRTLASIEKPRRAVATLEALDAFAKARHLDRDPQSDLAVLISHMRRAMETVDAWWLSRE
jgi:hypothetical protein